MLIFSLSPAAESMNARRQGGVSKLFTVDVRDEKAYLAGHLPTAINIPHTLLEEDSGEFRKRMDVLNALKGEHITLCTYSNECESTFEPALEYLVSQGFPHVSCILDGYVACHQVDMIVFLFFCSHCFRSFFLFEIIS